MARLIFALAAALCLQAFSADLTKVRSFTLPFPASDIEFDTARNRAYVIDADTREVLAVNLGDGSIAHRFSFSIRPETLAMQPDGKRLYVAMPTGNHDYYWFGGHTGYVGVVNLELNEKVKEFMVNVDPYDIIATDDGWIVIPDGSGQWTEIVSFNPESEARINALNIRQMSRIALHPNQTQFYTADTDTSPSDIQSWKIDRATGQISNAGDSPYHGDYGVGGNVFVHPNGSNLFVRAGNVFTSSPERAEDMRHVKGLQGGGVEAVYFDRANRATFTAGPKTFGGEWLLSYYGENLDLVRQYAVTNSVRAMTGDAGILTVVSVPAGRTVFEVFANPAAGGITNAEPVANFAWTPQSVTTTNVVTFDAGLSTDDGGGANLIYRWDFEADGTWEVPFTNQTTTSTRFNLAGTRTIWLEVMDRFGAVSRVEKNLNVRFEADPGTPGGGNPAYQLQFAATDVALDVTRLRLFATDSENKKLVVMNLTNGFIEREFTFTHTPQFMAVTPNGENLFVTLIARPHSPYWFSSHTGYVAQISLPTLTKVGEVRVDMDPYKIVATDNGILAISGGSDQWTEISMVAAATGTILARQGSVYMGADLALHPNQRALYFGNSNLSPADYSRIDFDPTNGAVLTAWDSPYHGDHAISGQPFVTPDGRHVISQGSAVLSSSSDRALDLRFVQNLARGNFSWLWFDPANDAIFTVGVGTMGTNSLQYFNEQFEPVQYEHIPHDVDRVFGTERDIYLVAREGDRTTISRRTNPASEAKFNQLPVAAFFFNPGSEQGRYYGIFANASGSTDERPNELLYRWDFEADGTYDLGYTNSPLAQIYYSRPGSYTLRLEVKDKFGRTNSVEQAVQIAPLNFPGVPYGPPSHDAFKIPFLISMAAFDPLQPRAFVVPGGNNNVEVIDLATGYLDRQYLFEHRPETMTIAPNGKQMFVGFSAGHQYDTGGAPHRGWVAEFDLEQMMLVNYVEVPIDPSDMVATDSGLVIISDGSGLLSEVGVFRASTWEKLGSVMANANMALDLHPSQELVYMASNGMFPGQISSLTLSPEGQLGFHGSMLPPPDESGINVHVVPDGSGVFSWSGKILTSSTNPVEDLKPIATLPVNPVSTLAFDTNRALVALAHRESVAFVNYRSNTLVMERSVPTDLDGFNIIGKSGSKVAVIKNSPPNASEILFLNFPAANAEENTAPTITLTGPGTNLVVLAGHEVNFSIEAADSDGVLREVRFFKSPGQRLETWVDLNDSEATFSRKIVVPAGVAEFYAVAIDNFNRSSTSAVVRVRGNVTPTVQFVEPAQDVLITGLHPVILRVATEDPEGPVSRLRFFANEQLIGTTAGVPELAFTPPASGTYIFTVEVTDSDGAVGYAGPLRVFFSGAQDHCCSDTGMLVGTAVNVSTSTRNATRQKDEPLHAGVAGGKSMWWSWRAPANGLAVLETWTSDFDTLLAVYIKGGPGAGLSSLLPVAANDDAEGIAPWSRVKFAATAGTTYYIAIDGREGVSGEAKLLLQFRSQGGPENDFLGSARAIGVTETQAASNLEATKEPGEASHAGNPGGASLWWRLQAPSRNRLLEVSTDGSSFDTVLAVYTNAVTGGTSFTPPVLHQNLRLVASNDDAGAASYSSKLSITTRPGTTYWIAVDGYNGAQGNVQLRVLDRTVPFVFPENDHFANALALTGTAAIASGNSRFGSAQNGEPFHALTGYGSSIWWRWTAPSNGPVYLSTKGSSFDTVLAVYTGTNVAQLMAVAANDDDPAGLETSALLFNAITGTEYRIVVDGHQEAEGDVVLALNQVGTPSQVGPRIISQFSQGRLNAMIEGTSGNVVLESSGDLRNWQAVATFTVNQMIHIEPPRTGSGQQYYRVRVAE